MRTGFLLVFLSNATDVFGWSTRVQLSRRNIQRPALREDQSERSATEIARRAFVAAPFIAAAAVSALPSASWAAGKENPDVAVLSSTALELRKLLADSKGLEAALAAENAADVVKLPRQVPRITFQKVEKLAKDVEADQGGFEEGFFPAEDFMIVATEYAEHAGAARDLAKLAALGRVGENGSEEVAKGYAKRCVEEVQAASALLSVLATSVQQ